MTKKVSLVVIAVLTIYFQFMYFIDPHKDFSEIENRAMTLFPSLTADGLFEGTFQGELENALKDQIHLRYKMIEFTSLLKSSSKKYVNYVYSMIPNFTNLPSGGQSTVFNPGDEQPEPVDSEEEQNSQTDSSVDINEPETEAGDNPVQSGNTEEQADASSAVKCWLEPYGNVYKINGTDCLSHYPLLESSLYKVRANIRVNQIKEILNRHPDVKAYVYYITKSEDLSWFDESEGIKAFDYASYIESILPDEVSFSKLKFKDLDELIDLSFLTDHHWNDHGSYQGYKDIYEMLSKDFALSPLKEPINELDFDGLEFIGSKGRTSGLSVVPDKFKAYDFDLGEYISFVGGQQREYGAMESYKQGKMNRDKNVNHYMTYYGTEETHSVVKHIFPNNEYNLLYLGDSNNRAIRRVLASHFNTTVFVDYRMFSNTDIDKIIEENNIDAVLFSGQYLFWNGQETFQTLKNYPVKAN